MDEGKVDGASSRRDVLKATGAVAVGAATFFAAAGSLGDEAGAVVDHLGVVHIPTSITMTVGGKALGKVSSVSTVTQSVGVIRTVDSSGVRHFTRDNRNSSNDTMVERTFDGDTTLRKWFAGTTVAGTNDPQAIPLEVVLTLRGRNLSQIGRLTLVNAWPSSWSGPDWNVPEVKAVKLTEKVTIVHEGWTLV